MCERGAIPKGEGWIKQGGEFEQGEVETSLPWPLPWETFPERERGTRAIIDKLTATHIPTMGYTYWVSYYMYTSFTKQSHRCIMRFETTLYLKHCPLCTVQCIRELLPYSVSKTPSHYPIYLYS